MDKTKSPSADIVGKGDVTTDQPNVVDFAVLIADMSHLLAGLSSIGHFKSSSVGLAEWTALSFISQSSGPVEKAKVTRALGLSRDRADQVITMLKKLALIKVDDEHSLVSLTPAGRDELNTKNADLQRLLCNALQKRPQAVVNAGKQLRQVSRILAVEKRGRRSGGPAVAGRSNVTR